MCFSIGRILNPNSKSRKHEGTCMYMPYVRGRRYLVSRNMKLENVARQHLNEISHSVGIRNTILDDNNEIRLSREDATTTRMPIHNTLKTDYALMCVQRIKCVRHICMSHLRLVTLLYFGYLTSPLQDKS